MVLTSPQPIVTSTQNHRNQTVSTVITLRTVGVLASGMLRRAPQRSRVGIFWVAEFTVGRDARPETIEFEQDDEGVGALRRDAYDLAALRFVELLRARTGVFI